jgi:hypothetical protein
MAMMAMTTSNSSRVNARPRFAAPGFMVFVSMRLRRMRFVQRYFSRGRRAAGVLRQGVNMFAVMQITSGIRKRFRTRPFAFGIDLRPADKCRILNVCCRVAPSAAESGAVTL